MINYRSRITFLDGVIVNDRPMLEVSVVQVEKVGGV